MFKIIGKDGKEYGPATEADIKGWIAQGRIDAQSQIREEQDTHWTTLGERPEFANAFSSARRPAVPPPAIPPPVESRVSSLAIASLVLGVLGLFTLGITAIPGVIFGIVALVKIQKSQSRLGGSGLAIAGICVSGLALVILPIMAAMLLPALAKAKTKAQQIQCMNQVKQLNLALVMYANDNHDRLPPADKWCDLIKPYTGGSTAVYHCPSQPAGSCSYALNAGLANQTLPTDPPIVMKTVLLFCSSEGWNRAGGSESVTPHQHSPRSVTVGFVDGHVEVTRLDRLPSFVWTP